MRGLLGTVGTAVILLAASAYGQIAFDFTGGGIRAQGMGKAYYGVSDDITAGTWNPAGLIALEKPMLGLSMGSFAPRGKFDLPSISQSYNLSGSFSGISYIGFLAPIRIRGHQFVASGSYGKVSEDYDSPGITGDFILMLPALVNNTLDTFMLPTNSTVKSSRHYMPYAVNFAFGTKIYENYSFGLGMNIFSGKAVTSSVGVLTTPNYPDANTGYLDQSATQIVTISTLDSATYSGVNFVLGFKRTSEKLDVGLVIKTPFSLRYNYNGATTTITNYAGLPVLTDTTYNDNQLTKFEMPLTIGAGIGYHARENLLLAFDAELRQFSGKHIQDRIKRVILAGGNTEEEYAVIDPKWRNSFVLRGGAEYTWQTGNPSFPNVPIRLGLGYIPIPYPNVNSENTYTGATEYTISGGFGIKWTQIHLDFAYTYAMLNRSGFFGNLNIPYQYSESKTRLHSVGMMFTGTF